jgi:hypothetical protein
VSSGAIEALKWLALLCMVVDHVNAALYGRELGVLADVVGRIALPLFACVFGFNLARPGVDAGRVMLRLLLAGALAVPAHAALFGYYGPWPFNILFTFALAAWIVVLLRARCPGVALASFVVGGALVEYWWPGVALVLATYAAARSPRLTVADAVAVGLALVGLCVLVNGNAYALLAVPLALVVVYLAPHVPRLRGWFLWFYPVHLCVLALVVHAW